MEGIRATPFAGLVAKALGEARFTLIDIGCSSGIHKAWRAFGDRLRAVGFDPQIEEIGRLSDSETFEDVRYVAEFVGLPAGHKDATLLRRRRFWGREPFTRTSAAYVLRQRRASHPPTDVARMASPANAIYLPDFLQAHDIRDVDFVKIDVDGPDFIILRAMIDMLAQTRVLGVGAEVNFYGTDAPDVNSFHNVDRLLRAHGFDLFALTTRPYSTAALPAPFQLTIPAQTLFGRVLQGDAIYLRDLAAPEESKLANSMGWEKLLKLAALFSLANLPDCAAEVLVTFRSSIEPHLNVETALDMLVEQTIPPEEPVPTYAEYMQDFETGGPRFWPALQPPPEEAPPSPPPESEELIATRAALHEVLTSTSWRLTAPLRVLVKTLKRTPAR